MLADYGERLRRLRLAKGYNQEGAAELSTARIEKITGQQLARPRTDGWVSDVETGQIDASLTDVVALAGALGARVALVPDGDRRQRVIEAIHGDDGLDPVARDMLLAAYEAARPRREPARSAMFRLVDENGGVGDGREEEGRRRSKRA